MNENLTPDKAQYDESFTERVEEKELGDVSLPNVNVHRKSAREKAESAAKQVRFWQAFGVAVIASVAAVVAVVAMILPLRPTESAAEKRKLTEFPSFSSEALFSGDYFDGISKWYSDTVPFRDQLISVNAKIQALLGTNGVNLGFQEGKKGDDAVLDDEEATFRPDLDDVTPIVPGTTLPPEDISTTEEPAVTDEPSSEDEPSSSEPSTGPAPVVEKLGAIAKYGSAGYEYYNFVQSTADEYITAVSRAGARLRGVATVYDMIIPTSIDVTMPDDARAQLSEVVSDQKKAISYMENSMTQDVLVVPIFDLLRAHRDEYIYFRTDHHWTGLGAYYAYRKFCEIKGVAPLQLSDYDKRDFSGFLGSFYNDSGQDPDLAQEPDVVETFMPKVNAELTIYDKNGNASRGAVIFDETNAPAAYKYGAFIWGDNPLSVIENLDMEEGESILLVKESFGNALAPLLCAHYKYVYIMDYRYYNGTVAGLAAEKGISDVLFCNNVSMTRGASQVQLLKDHIG